MTVITTMGSVMDDGRHNDGMTNPLAIGGESYFWRLTGLVLSDEGELQPLCQPTNWLSFQLGALPSLPSLPWLSAPPPPPAPEPEEEPAEEACAPTVTATMNLTCRYGPASEYEERGYLLAGETALVEGRNVEGTWWYIPNPDWQDFCWIWDGGVESDCIPDDLLVIIPPPAARTRASALLHRSGAGGLRSSRRHLRRGQSDGSVPVCHARRVHVPVGYVCP